jgi:hypothetical protein
LHITHIKNMRQAQTMKFPEAIDAMGDRLGEKKPA